MSNVKPIFNPITGELDFVRSSSSFDNPNTAIRNVSSSVQIGDLVTESDIIVNGVETAVSNLDIKPVIGIVIDKPSSTTAEVLFRGTVTGFTGLIKARKVFLGELGEASSIVPTTGYIQTLGTARDVDTLDFSPQLNRVLRS